MGRSELQQLLELKRTAKEKVMKQTFSSAPKTALKLPLIAIIEPEDGKERDMFFQLLMGMRVLSCYTIVISSDEAPDTVKHPEGRLFWVNNKTLDKKKMNELLLSADMAVLFEDYHKMVPELFKVGIIPLGLEASPFLENYHPNDETGNSFTFSEMDPWAVFMALVRATETYRFPFDWQNMIRMMLKVR